MKLIPRQRRPLRSLRSRHPDAAPRVTEPERCTPVTMDKRGGMACDAREPSGMVLNLGSRFRLAHHQADRDAAGVPPAARAYRVSVVANNVTQRLLGLPLLRLEVETQRGGQAYRVLEPSTSRFRMRSKDTAPAEPDPRFHTAGRGGPKLMLETADPEPDEQD